MSYLQRHRPRSRRSVWVRLGERRVGLGGESESKQQKNPAAVPAVYLFRNHQYATLSLKESEQFLLQKSGKKEETDLASFDAPIHWHITVEKVNNQTVGFEVEITGLAAHKAIAVDNDRELLRQVHWDY